MDEKKRENASDGVRRVKNGQRNKETCQSKSARKKIREGRKEKR